ncbi:hypothetical protein [Bacillus pseudomycoides]|uniref:hypothetical protein n=1 Tax=Bacillus pseudomycoides TaxID=64104 RepID=UPI000BEF727C|nr:hypothetical protein [Bacillus pseudomycoides]PEJ21503.1 hypothetical protein CN677_30430 [Bacillus pseudomycoides]PHA81398.1 hypothetical protein COE78_25350 [Bacillus pseudomycoides]PHC67270.1 hypothetical protein COF38_27705 [Bacillus pseudomycoides]
MKRKWKAIVAVGIMGLSLLGVSIPKASASMTDPQYWRTEDGAWDGNVTTGILNRVEVDLTSIYKTNRNNYVQERWSDTSMLSVRLCKPGGVGCTGWESFSNTGGLPYAIFSGLAYNQKYYVDIRDSWSNYYFSGKLIITYQ